VRQAVTLIAAAAAVLALAAVAAPGQAVAESRPRWERAVVTVHVADTAAWSRTDVAGSLAGWSQVVPMVLTDDPGADVVLDSGATQDAAPTAYPVVEGSRITSCRVTLPTRLAGTDATFVLPHELGHCLGLTHGERTGAGPSVMFWVAGGDSFSATPTAADLRVLRGVYAL
jgi:hypothetical protein